MKVWLALTYSELLNCAINIPYNSDRAIIIVVVVRGPSTKGVGNLFVIVKIVLSSSSSSSTFYYYYCLKMNGADQTIRQVGQT